VKSPASYKKKLAIATIVACALASWFWYQDEDRTDQKKVSVERSAASGSQVTRASRRADFDFYLLAMTVHPAFCADGHAGKAECLAGHAAPLSIHGLWPESEQPGTYPRDCPGPPLDLAGPLESELVALMPGMTDGLHRHEWRRHGTCSGLGDDDYFRHTLRMARSLDQALRGHLTTLAGRSTTAAELRSHANRAQAGLGGSLTFHCRTLRDAPVRGEPYLIEIRQCVDDDGARGAPGSMVSCETFGRRDQGCGRTFHIAGVHR
jgi:ribonuclease I